MQECLGPYYSSPPRDPPTNGWRCWHPSLSRELRARGPCQWSGPPWPGPPADPAAGLFNERLRLGGIMIPAPMPQGGVSSLRLRTEDRGQGSGVKLTPGSAAHLRVRSTGISP
eukprot:3018612-Rhodomonas_salina.1